MNITLDNFNRTGFILGCENWDRYDFKALLKLVKSFVLLVWDMRKNKLYGDQDGTTPGCSCSCPLTGDLTSSIRLHLWVRGQWRKRYGSNMSILLLLVWVNMMCIIMAYKHDTTCMLWQAPPVGCREVPPVL